MVAAAILNFGKMSITLDWIKISCMKLHGKMQRRRGDDYLTKSRNRKLIRVTSSNEGLKYNCVSVSVTITDIRTKFGTEHRYHTTNTPEWPNSHKLKIQDGGGRHLEFRKNFNFGLDKDILHQIIWEDAARRRGDDHVTKSRKRT